VEQDQHDSYIRVRVSSKLKTKFKAKCKKNAINLSEWFRQRMEEFVNSKDKNK